MAGPYQFLCAGAINAWKLAYETIWTIIPRAAQPVENICAPKTLFALINGIGCLVSSQTK